MELSVNASLRQLGIATLTGLIAEDYFVSGFISAFHAPPSHDLPVAIVAALRRGADCESLSPNRENEEAHHATS